MTDYTGKDYSIEEQLEMDFAADRYAMEQFEEEKARAASRIDAILLQYTLQEINSGLEKIASRVRIVTHE